MDFIIELFMEIIFEFVLEAITEKKIPIAIRILLAVLVLAFYIGLVGLLIYIGITNESGLIIGIAVFLLILVTAAAFKKYKKMK